MDSELLICLLKFIEFSQNTFRHCCVRFYAFFGQPFVETAVFEQVDYGNMKYLFTVKRQQIGSPCGKENLQATVLLGK